MPIKACVYIATSLDGFIARLDGSIDWLNEANTLIPEGEDFGYREFMAKTDAIIMGRITFEQALTFSDWPYVDKKMVVLSRKGVEIPEELRQSVSVSSLSPKQLLENLTSQGMRQIYVDGGLTIQSFLREGLINELTITVIPILLGSGRPLFGSLKSDITLRHVFTKSYPIGFVQSKYAVEKKKIQ